MEARIMLNLNHPNVMPLIGVALDEEMPLLIIPFMINGTLLHYLRINKGSLYHTQEAIHEQVEKIIMNIPNFMFLMYEGGSG